VYSNESKICSSVQEVGDFFQRLTCA